jgi:small conductance mechanosensitive channel
MKPTRNRPATICRKLLAVAILLISAEKASAQLPGMPIPPQGQGGGASKKVASAREIKIDDGVSDRELSLFLGKFLPQHPGTRRIQVEVENGVVTLRGRVIDDDTRDDLTEEVKRVDGVRLVLNHLKTDEEVMGALEYALKELGTIGETALRNWLMILIAIGVVASAGLLARFINAKSEYLLAPFFRNPLLRAIFGSFLSSFVVIGGVLAALWLLKLTHIVLSILGLAGVVGLAVGFAFRDITENFIASILLGMRRPFQIGDYVKVAGQAGIVKSLDTRATILVTLEGSQVRIPNAIIFKEILVNSSATPFARNGFDLLIPYDVSTAAALEAITGALRSQAGVLADPPPRAFVDALEEGGVRLRTVFWIPTKGIDGDQLTSDAKLKVKVALQRIDIAPSSPRNEVMLRVADRLPIVMIDDKGEPREAGDRHETSSAADSSCAISAADLRRDDRASNSAVAMPDLPAPIEKALERPAARYGEGSDNLLKNGNDKEK